MEVMRVEVSMRVALQDLEETGNPLNDTQINEATALVEILDRLRFRKPFGLELICENGFILSICLAEKYGALEYKLRNGDPPYMQAVAPGSRPMPNEANPYAAAVKADNDSGTEPPEFLVGGTATPVPTRYILPYEMVKEIAAYFLETGQRKPDTFWEEI